MPTKTDLEGEAVQELDCRMATDVHIWEPAGCEGACLPATPLQDGWAPPGAWQGLCILEHLAQVTFEDVAIYFSRQEWAELTGWQKALYWEVMEELYCQLARRLPGRATEGVHRVTSPRPYSGSHDGRPLPKTPAWVRLRRTSLPGEPQEQSLDSRLAG
ncbi:uncharacterized protein LOC143821071 isoform X3 [Paroedura picta]|uniref:uncharacterized protein LOC143821071 isoform X3 n=1 Tax=Paroedura picta TaxID=143630 RepID=UPI00405754D3